jgi:hypothetical protein
MIFDPLAFFGLCAVTALLVFYALEDRSHWFILAFAGACVLGSVYGFLHVRGCRSNLGRRCRPQMAENFKLGPTTLSLSHVHLQKDIGPFVSAFGLPTIQHPGWASILVSRRFQPHARTQRRRTFSRPTEAAAIRCAALSITCGREVPWWHPRRVAPICYLSCR